MSFIVYFEMRDIRIGIYIYIIPCLNTMQNKIGIIYYLTTIWHTEYTAKKMR